jgi:L-fuconolactonase
LAKGIKVQKVIDSHFHIWCQKDLPWLTGPMIPRIFGPYDAIRRDYSIEEFLADQNDSGVEKAVYVQTNWARDRFEDEVAWVQKTADETGWPHATVGFVDMMSDDVRPQLDRIKRYPLLRGVRMQLHWHETPEYRFAPSADQIVDSRVRKNIGHLKEYGLSFDLQLFPGQMRDGARLVEEHPETNFIMTHAGMLIDLSTETTEEWKAGLRQFCGKPNFYAKLSGLGTFAHKNDPNFITYVVDEMVGIFGSAHLMCGSNFPVEKLWTDLAPLIKAYRAAVGRHGSEASADIFWKTARWVYRPA